MIFPLGGGWCGCAGRGDEFKCCVSPGSAGQSVWPSGAVLRGPEQHGADNHCQQSEAICSGLDF